MTPQAATLDTPPPRQQAQQPARRAVSRAGEPLRCFLVEDNAVIRQNLIATLEEMLTVEVIGTAEDEPGALRWLQSAHKPCDLVIIDLFLKHGSGFGVLSRVHELMPEAHPVVLSNYATPDIRRRCLALGAERVFDKSAELEDLLDHCGALGARPR
jgi:DNA-binding NarL/FixJ family response regulator